jgi:hypothetical protein
MMAGGSISERIVSIGRPELRPHVKAVGTANSGCMTDRHCKTDTLAGLSSEEWARAVIAKGWHATCCEEAL